MELIRNFQNINRNDVAFAGGKGASLGEMTQAGISVPPGFVILSSAFEKFLEETDLNVEINSILGLVDHKEIHTVENASEKIRSLIMGAEVPSDIVEAIQKYFKQLNAEYVAIRSSATAEDSASAAWAGQLESYLNTTEVNLLDNIKKCWASLFTPRAIFYRFEKDLQKQKVSVAVVIQKMVESEKSGIAFSVHPVTQDRNQIIIEAGFGLGEAIVSGQITPDSYVVRKDKKIIIDKNVQLQTKGLYRSMNGGSEWREIPNTQGANQCLSDEEIIDLVNLIIKIESHYNFPCDIEWALEKGIFYITQSRPITTLSSVSTLPPFTSDYWMYLGQWHQSTLSSCFWCYWNTSNSAKMLFPDVDFCSLPSLDCQFWLAKKDVEIFNNIISDLDGNNTKIKEFTEKLSLIGEKTKKDSLRIIDIDKNYKEYIPELFSAYKEIIGVWTSSWFLGDELGKYLVKKKIYSEEELLNIVGKNAKPTWLEDEYKSIKKIGDQISKLNAGSKTENDIEKIIESNPILLQTVKSHISEYEWFGTHHWMGEPYDFKKCISEIAEYLGKQKIDNVSENIKTQENNPLVNLLLELTYWRTHMAEVACKLVYLSRPKLQEFASKISLSYEDLIFLSDQEIIRMLKNGSEFKFAEIISERKKAHGCYIDNGLLVIPTGIELEKIIKSLNYVYVANDEDLKGLVACKGGIVTGRAVIVISPSDFKDFQKGDVLIVPETTPDFVPYMQKSIAVVTDRGGVTSHAAIISREMKIPCIIGTNFATKKLKTGMMIEVDSNNGIIKVVK